MRKFGAIALVFTLFVATMSTVSAFALAKQSDPLLGSEPADLAEWTVMVYCDGDNNLELNAIDDLLEMEMVGSTSEVSIIVMMDTYSLLDTNAHWYFVDDVDEGIEHVDLAAGTFDCDCAEILGVDECPCADPNMGDPETLKNFIVTAVDYAPARNYFLVLWDHGGGWYGVCWDDSSLTYDDRVDRLTVHETAEAIKAAQAITGVKLRVIGYDSCLNGMIEIAYENRDLADYMVASITSIPVAGWPYDLWLGDLVKYPTMSIEKLSESLVDRYVESYSTCAGEGLGGWNAVGLSFFDLSVMGELAAKIDDLAEQLIDIVEDDYSVRGAILSAVQSLTPAIEMLGQQFAFTDLGYFAEQLADNLADRFPAVSDTARDISDMVTEQAVMYTDWVKQTLGGAFRTTGISIYFPTAFNFLYLDYGYETLDEALDAGETIYYGMDFGYELEWYDFLLLFAQAYVES
jgi:hypothetical protein